MFEYYNTKSDIFRKALCACLKFFLYKIIRIINETLIKQWFTQYR